MTKKNEECWIMKKKAISTLLIAGMVTSMMVGCGKSSDSQKEADNSGVTTYTVGTEGAYPPFNLVNEKGEPDGYDIAVMKAIDELNPDIEFKYEATGWDGIFTALESGKIDIIASQCGKNEEREAKYLYPDYPYTQTQSAIVFKKDRTDISSDVNSIAGKTIVSATSGAQTNWLEKYNEENPDKAATILYADGDMSKMLQEVINGRADAHIASIKVTADYVIKEQGLDSELQCLPFDAGDATDTYMLLRQDESGEKLKKIIDDSLKTLSDNGTLKELSEKYLDGDYAPQL